MQQLKMQSSDSAVEPQPERSAGHQHLIQRRPARIRILQVMQYANAIDVVKSPLKVPQNQQVVLEKLYVANGQLSRYPLRVGEAGATQISAFFGGTEKPQAAAGCSQLGSELGR